MALILLTLCLGAALNAAPLGDPPTPSAGDAVISLDGRYRWVEGDPFVLTAAAQGRQRKIPLPAPESKSLKRRVLFAERGPRFCLLEEGDSELGLHLGLSRGAEKAKALVVASKLYLIDGAGRVLWSRKMPEKAVVGRAADARSLRIADDGTLAVLLQDVDPYGKERPTLLVIDPGGRELMSLDYTAWARIDEFALSYDGRSLAVRGFGLVPEEEGWSKAVGRYQTRSGQGKVRSLAKAEAGSVLTL